MTIQNNSVVSIHYTLTNDAGGVIDSSQGGSPLNYLHGANNIIPGLENALVGKTQGDKLKVVVEPKEGYGEHIPQLVQQAPMEAFQGVEELSVGMRFETQTDSGQMIPVRITEIQDGMVTVDGNHELAGVRLTFDVEIVEVRDASPEEVDNGHVHDGTHHH